MSHFSSSKFDALSRTVYDIVRGIPALRKVSKHRLDPFCLDVSIVALAIRTGYLVDAFCVSNPLEVFPSLVQALFKASDSFKDLRHLYDPQSDQSFFVNISLLRERFQTLCNDPLSLDMDDQRVEFVALTDPPTLVSSPLPHLASTMKGVLQLPDIMTSHSLSQRGQDLSPLDFTLTIPLAAIVLEYPIAYVPMHTPHPTPFLSGVPLDVYEVTLSLSSGVRHVMMKFSCPASVGMDYPERLSSDRLKERLRERFRARLEAMVGGGNGGDVEIGHRVEVLDRVAL
ncbi:hypothetical protein JAAARDRAFT_203477 [Jaapia argillacea MUCL 33604]|uniref:Uncharacterized protein n=1 Tax=Jaapia argillacea MUCL 33604 TaxID=933084 RepID=A0A067QI89_9AGAM|nr:hypothetical protein JAAARDRAFT_203477 [Jaapia argillacea MUCL 33604]